MMTPITQEQRRKLVHLSGLLLLPLLPRYPLIVIWVMAGAAVFYLLLEILRIRGRKLPFFSDFAESCKRPYEMGKIGWAAPLLSLGIILSILFFDYPATACGFVQVCLSDTAAALVGQKWGKAKIFYAPNKKLIGSIAFFLTALVGCLLYIPLWISLPLATIGAVLESFPLRDWDNFVIPLGVSFAASLLLWP
ncbi:MAG: hypothetical protein HYS22_08080 [Deltaproteobacteria bacterium]|nr:hypothetical protein [Deltaproteobacteria bacterium]